MATISLANLIDDNAPKSVRRDMEKHGAQVVDFPEGGSGSASTTFQPVTAAVADHYSTPRDLGGGVIVEYGDVTGSQGHGPDLRMSGFCVSRHPIPFKRSIMPTGTPTAVIAAALSVNHEESEILAAAQELRARAEQGMFIFGGQCVPVVLERISALQISGRNFTTDTSNQLDALKKELDGICQK